MAKRRGKPPRIPQVGTHGMDDALHDYAVGMSPGESPELAALRRETWVSTVAPQMLSDELQGRLLSAISRMIAPNRILELGTFTGYATACLAEGLGVGGVIDTVDREDELIYMQDKHWESMGIRHQIRRHIGMAKDILDSGVLMGKDLRPFDLLLIDADKENQRLYLDWACQNVRVGGWIVVDNVLWWGDVVNVASGSSSEPRAVAIHELNAYIRDHDQLDNVLLPLRDGLQLIQRTK
ncbi:MAG: O-methyltransferase [Bacteroidetes bacterium]|nr:O-methyltransferase [Bacteroidota bacterium]MDA0904530.1 O-methyltransferase [Bacteroidota bacterium]